MKSTLFLLAASTLAGCAGMAGQSPTQQINVHTEPEGAECELVNRNGRWHVTSPGTVAVVPSGAGALLGGNLNVSCSKGTLTGSDYFLAGPRGAGWLNGAFGGAGYALDGSAAVGYRDSFTIKLKAAQ